MGIALSEDAILDFPSGSMFWARSSALRPLLDVGLTFEDFSEEPCEIDGTLAHAIERIYYFVCERAAFKWIKISQPTLFEQTPAIVHIDCPEAIDFFPFHSRFDVNRSKSINATHNRSFANHQRRAKSRFASAG